jgi:hypothetical protein
MKEFNSEAEAWDWMDSLGFEYMDNERFAFTHDPEEMQEYNEKQSQGCCGFFDEKIMVDGRLAMIGCNYGH